MRHAGWRAAALAALLLFLFFGDVPDRVRFWEAFFDAGHAALFGVIALLLRGWLAAAQPRIPLPRLLVTAFALAVGLGALTEILQTLQAHGDPSLVDFARDTAGAGAFLLLSAAGDLSRGRRQLGSRLAAVLVALALLFAAGWHLLVVTAEYVARDRAFPTLYALDGSWWEHDFIELEGNRLTPGATPSRPVAGYAGTLARLDLAPAVYSGIVFDEPYPDWRGYRQLAFDVVSDLEQPIALAIRVHDAAHDQRYADRFNRRLAIAPGFNRVVIPLEDIRKAPDRRQMDLRHIRGVLLFTYRLDRPARLYLGPLRLE